MNPIFKPKDRDEVLADIAKGRYANRALLIGVYEKNPELFDRFFDSLMKLPKFDIQAIIKVLVRTLSLNITVKDADEAVKIIKIFTTLKFNTSKFKLSNNPHWNTMTLVIIFDDPTLLNYYDKLADSFMPHKKKRKKRQAKKPLGF